jgi:hypothetical protein
MCQTAQHLGAPGDRERTVSGACRDGWHVPRPKNPLSRLLIRHPSEERLCARANLPPNSESSGRQVDRSVEEEREIRLAGQPQDGAHPSPGRRDATYLPNSRSERFYRSGDNLLAGNVDRRPKKMRGA